MVELVYRLFLSLIVHFGCNFRSMIDTNLKGENSVTHEIGPINSDFSKNVEQMKKLISVF